MGAWINRRRSFILGTFIGLILTGLAFSNGTAMRCLDYGVLPGTIAFLIISGGEAGSTQLMFHIATASAFLVNAVLYGFLGLLSEKLIPRNSKTSPTSE
jgi:hypothetical protein